MTLYVVISIVYDLFKIDGLNILEGADTQRLTFWFVILRLMLKVHFNPRFPIKRKT